MADNPHQPPPIAALLILPSSSLSSHCGLPPTVYTAVSICCSISINLFYHSNIQRKQIRVGTRENCSFEKVQKPPSEINNIWFITITMVWNDGARKREKEEDRGDMLLLTERDGDRRRWTAVGGERRRWKEGERTEDGKDAEKRAMHYFCSFLLNKFLIIILNLNP